MPVPSPTENGGTTSIRPDGACHGMLARMLVLLMTVNSEGPMGLKVLTPPKRTSTAPVKFVPMIVTLVPGRPLVGEKLAMPGVTKKFVALENLFEMVLKFCVGPSDESAINGP